jgi:hypothetical protein
MTPGPIFISHSSVDHDAVNALTAALREAFGGHLRTFNTSTGSAIPAGDMWRNYILAALKASPATILWATPNALQSREVAFEIGAAMAYGLPIISCCVHISPSTLPWGLAERQALVMDSESGWEKLPEELGTLLNFQGVIDSDPLKNLSDVYEAPGDALELSAVGHTLEFRNISATPISEIRVSGSDVTDWSEALESTVLDPGGFVVLLRDPNPRETSCVLSWKDIAGVSHSREVSVKGTAEGYA